ncbi:aromatic amino acid lyase, partial [Rhizobium ruizarguesonis]
AKISASATGMARIAIAREVVEDAIASGIPVYGSTTVVGAMKDVEWSADELDTFNLGLVRAACAMQSAADSSRIVTS